MASEVLWSTPTSTATPTSGQTVNNGAGHLGSEIDNSTAKKRFASFELNFQHGSAPTANRVWLLYLLVAQGGTDYEQGDGSTRPSKMHTVAFPVLASTSAQRITIPNVPIPPFKFKTLIWNDTGVNSSSSSVTLNVRTYGEEIEEGIEP